MRTQEETGRKKSMGKVNFHFIVIFSALYYFLFIEYHFALPLDVASMRNNLVAQQRSAKFIFFHSFNMNDVEKCKRIDQKKKKRNTLLMSDAFQYKLQTHVFMYSYIFWIETMQNWKEKKNVKNWHSSFSYSTSTLFLVWRFDFEMYFPFNDCAITE